MQLLLDLLLGLPVVLLVLACDGLQDAELLAVGFQQELVQLGHLHALEVHQTRRRLLRAHIVQIAL